MKKQKKDPTKSDWFQLLTKDFQFIEETMDENKIISMSKVDYKKFVKQLVKKAAFKCLIEEKNGHTKIKNINYNE